MTTSSRDHRTKAELLEENEQLRARLDEAEQTLDAIRSGDVDALIVAGPQGDQVFSLTGAERTYRLIIETMNESALTVDLAGTILFCNQRFAGMVKSPMAEIIGRKLTNFVAPAQQPPLQQLLADARAVPVQRSLKFRAADGAVVSVQLAASPLVDVEGNTSICLVTSDLTELEEQADSIRVLLAHQQALEESKNELQAANAALHQSRLAALNVSEDAIAARRQAEELSSHLQREVTERKRAEDALRESEALYRGIGESIDYGVWVCAPDGRNSYASESFLKMAGITQEQCSNFGWGDMLHPDDAERTIAAWRECVSTGGNWDTEHRFRGMDGKWHYVLARGVPIRNEDGEIIRWVGINLDISKIKQTEQELRESKKRLGMVLQASSMGTFEVDLHTGEGQWNDVEYELLGLKPGEAPGTPATFFQYVHPNDVEAMKVQWEEALQFGGLDVEFRIVRADGQERWMAGKGRFLHDSTENNQAIRFLGVNFDITERKRAEGQIKASLAEKEVLLKEIHHRVKNNLQVISSLISLQADNLTDERMRNELNDVRDRVRSMALIHEKLYQTSDLARLNFADYAASLLHSLWRSHGALAAKAGLNLDLRPFELPVEAAVPCGLILNELAGNALKHAFPNDRGGEVTVGLEHDPSIGAVSLRVHDNGVGLPEGLEWRQSRSLGLRLVRILADQLGGAVETGTGPGTEFHVTFTPKGFQA